MRLAVEAFAEEMENKLLRNDHKGGWATCDLTYLERKLLEEIIEYLKDGREGELVDISNFCMMLWNRKEETGLYA